MFTLIFFLPLRLWILFLWPLMSCQSSFQICTINLHDFSASTQTFKPVKFSYYWFLCRLHPKWKVLQKVIISHHKNKTVMLCTGTICSVCSPQTETESLRSLCWLLLLMLLKNVHLPNLNISATNTSGWWASRDGEKCRSRCHPSPCTDSSALLGPITQVWSGVMTYHRARRGWGSMKKRGCDTEREWGWWGVNYLHLAGMSHRRYSRYLLSTAFHHICLTFAAAGPCFLSAEQCIGSMPLVKSLELPFSLL